MERLASSDRKTDADPTSAQRPIGPPGISGFAYARAYADPRSAELSTIKLNWLAVG